MENIIIALIILLIVGLAGVYIYKAKKSGRKCIGCPDSKTCQGNCASCNSCCQGKTEKE
ncbi:MAG: FeoB-associated Cys-rich membrane protein [Clostridia bacterium]|nr:FeoB-associated Cys-rich membrane protein [Clostridia bacterium]